MNTRIWNWNLETYHEEASKEPRHVKLRHYQFASLVSGRQNSYWLHEIWSSKCFLVDAKISPPKVSWGMGFWPVRHRCHKGEIRDGGLVVGSLFCGSVIWPLTWPLLDPSLGYEGQAGDRQMISCKSPGCLLCPPGLSSRVYRPAWFYSSVVSGLTREAEKGRWWCRKKTQKKYRDM